MNTNPAVKFLFAALTVITLLIILALVFIRLADPTRETVSTAPPEDEVRQPRAPAPATSTAPGAPRNSEPPPVFATETDPAGTGTTP